MRAQRVVPMVLAAALALAACIIPQTDNILVEPIPEALNRPPRILEDTLQPPGRFVTVKNGSGCPNLGFVATVADPDLADTLYYDFFVDGDLSPGFVKQGVIGTDGQVVRSEPATYEVSFAIPNPLQQPGDHVVEVLVADAPLVGRTPQPPRPVRLPDGGTYQDASYAVSYAWTVTVVAGACP
ncbi:MAG TPA: hypothetical protein VLQ79_05655 [Myxococcaceae bacterium]|nr:hypothetical protein [Myxococcaceae bacterium]